jgi:hypothetical protein
MAVVQGQIKSLSDAASGKYKLLCMDPEELDGVDAKQLATLHDAELKIMQLIAKTQTTTGLPEDYILGLLLVVLAQTNKDLILSLSNGGDLPAGDLGELMKRTAWELLDAASSNVHLHVKYKKYY